MNYVKGKHREPQEQIVTFNNNKMNNDVDAEGFSAETAERSSFSHRERRERLERLRDNASREQKGVSWANSKNNGDAGEGLVEVQNNN